MAYSSETALDLIKTTGTLLATSSMSNVASIISYGVVNTLFATKALAIDIHKNEARQALVDCGMNYKTAARQVGFGFAVVGVIRARYATHARVETMRLAGDANSASQAALGFLADMGIVCTADCGLWADGMGEVLTEAKRKASRAAPEETKQVFVGSPAEIARQKEAARRLKADIKLAKQETAEAKVMGATSGNVTAETVAHYFAQITRDELVTLLQRGIGLLTMPELSTTLQALNDRIVMLKAAACSAQARALGLTVNSIEECEALTKAIDESCADGVISEETALDGIKAAWGKCIDKDYAQAAIAEMVVNYAPLKTGTKG